jgi:hypothetical protein
VAAQKALRHRAVAEVAARRTSWKRAQRVLFLGERMLAADLEVHAVAVVHTRSEGQKAAF